MMEPTRRNFIKGFAALAATAVSPVHIQALEQSDREKLVEMMKTGYVSGKTFVFHDGAPIVLYDMDRLVFRNCTFIWSNGLDERKCCFWASQISNLLMVNCQMITNAESKSVVNENQARLTSGNRLPGLRPSDKSLII